MHKKISVIIPVYNAMTSGGGYINRCVKSVLNQSNFPMEDIEVLLINDGSKDKSLEVLKSIKKEAPEVIEIIDQENMGVANTRNKGIQLATGEYIMFLDQDDWIDTDYLSTFYNVAKEGEYDVVIGGYCRPNSQGETIKVQKPTNKPFYRYRLIAAWAKIHKTSFLKENDIRFFNNSYGEDFPFTCHENVVTKSYTIIPYIGYNWFFNEESVSNTTQKGLNQKNVDDILKLFEELQRIREKCPSEQMQIYEYMMLRTCVYSLLFSLRSSTEQDFKAAIETLLGWMQVHCKGLFHKSKVKIPKFPSGESFLTKVIIVTFVGLYNINFIRFFSKLLSKKA